MRRHAVRGRRVGHYHLEPLGVITQLHPDRPPWTVLAVRLDRAGTRLADREANLVEQRLVDAAPAGYRGGDEPGGPHMRGQRREGDFDGGHGEWWLLLGLPGGDRQVHRVVDPEDLGETGDAEDLQDALLRAHEVQRPVVGADPLEPADQDPEARGVEELDPLHVHYQLVVLLVHKLDEQLAKARCGVDVDLTLAVHDLDAVLVAVPKLQIRVIPPAP